MPAAPTPAERLKNRSYLGLLLSQFLAAFNDQASHIVAIFFASDLLVRYAGVAGIDDKAVITLVTASYISPFFFFSPLAGVLADKYSKRDILIFWKLAEVGIMGIGLFAFALPHFTGWADQQTLAIWASVLAILVVFMMGTHSAFFVPAKYGIMPELLHPSILSRGNGLLEGTSFTANILGITFGGGLYSWLGPDTTTPGVLIVGQEWIIGAALFGLALVGAIGAFLIVPMPASDPNRPFDWQPWVPLRANLKVLRRYRSLAVAVIGIAFFTFMTLFLRQILLYQGETDKELQSARRLEREFARSAASTGSGSVAAESSPAEAHDTQQSELRIALLIGFVGLGVGIGCSLAGQLSGKKLELGLVPIGALFLVVTTASLAITVRANGGGSAESFVQVLLEEIRMHWPTIICLILIGMAAGLYIVPFYTLLQQAAPKGSKGGLVAMSNFLNVAGGLFAVFMFYFLTFALEGILGLNLDAQTVRQDPSLLHEYIAEVQTQSLLPKAQFLFASLITLCMIALLLQQRPDFLVRSMLWLRSHGRHVVHVEGLTNIPGAGQAILVTNFARMDDYLQLVAATDRFTRFVLLEGPAAEDPRLSLVRGTARRVGLLAAPPAFSTRDERERVLLAAEKTLQSGFVLAMSLPAEGPDTEAGKFLAELQRRVPSPIVPVYGVRGASSDGDANGGANEAPHLTDIAIGLILPKTASVAEASDALRKLEAEISPAKAV